MGIAVCLCCFGLLPGCAGGGAIELTALDYQTIDPPAPTLSKIEVDRAYWWEDADGYVWVSLERITSPLFGRLGKFVFQFSFAIDRPPASKRGRNYILGQREFRALLKLGPSETRLVSNSGILALYPKDGERMRGSFRMEATRQTGRLLGGWGPATRYLLLGTFDAVKDATRGAAIAQETESNGWERSPRPSTQPASTARSARRTTPASMPSTRPTPR